MNLSMLGVVASPLLFVLRSSLVIKLREGACSQALLIKFTVSLPKLLVIPRDMKRAAARKFTLCSEV